MNTRCWMKPTLLMLGLVLNGAALAKTQVFKWETELCRASASYDDQKVTAAQLDATLKLNADHLTSIYDEKNTQAQDDAEHRKNQAILQDPRNFIAHPVIETVRQRMIARDQFFYDLQRIKRDAAHKNDYAILNQFAPSQRPQCQNIVQILQSPPSAEKTAKALQLLKASCRDNADPSGSFETVSRNSFCLRSVYDLGLFHSRIESAKQSSRLDDN